MTANTPKRLLALDILRGITIAGMILVNNPGSWGHVYTPLEHAAFNGLTPTDLVFPFFMFIMGISTYISLRKYNFTYSHATLRKIVKRTVVIFCIGLFLNLLAKSVFTHHLNFEELRYLGVMQRLAIGYGVTSLVAITVKHKYFPAIILVTLAVYFLSCSFWVLIPISAPNPNWAPSVKAVDTFAYTQAASTNCWKRRIVSGSSLIMLSLCFEL